MANPKSASGHRSNNPLAPLPGIEPVADSLAPRSEANGTSDGSDQLLVQWRPNPSSDLSRAFHQELGDTGVRSSQALAKDQAEEGVLDVVQFSKGSRSRDYRRETYNQTGEEEIAEFEGSDYAQASSMRELSCECDLDGSMHFRYQLQINGLDVAGATRMVHRLNDGTSTEYGDDLAGQSGRLATSAAVAEANALQSALSWVGATTYKWDCPEEEAFIKAESGNPNASFKPQGQLVYYGSDPNKPGTQLRLAYCFDIYAQDPASRQLVYVDASRGNVLGSNEIFNSAFQSASATTGYSGARTIYTEQPVTTTQSYRLRETTPLSTNVTRTIATYNLKGSTSYASAVDFTDANNIWGSGSGDTYTTTTPKDIYALDAHFGAEQTYDFYLNNFGRNSIDGKGFALKSYVHYSTNYFNAFWDGTSMTYGDGSSANGNLPLTSLDVCGHEITHGLTAQTCKLTYSGESGALNEGFSDIFGTAIEAFAMAKDANKWNWTLGESFNYIIRDMSNPNRYSQPDTYKGTYWYTGTADYGGVHTNSGVLNYWFALLTEGSGGTGLTSSKEHSALDINGTTDTNDKGYKFSVRGLGLEKAQAVAYRTLTNYLIASSNYLDARNKSLIAAADFLKSNPYISNGLTLTQDDLVQTQYAWDAVGVGGGTSATFKSSFTGKDNSPDMVQGGQLGDIISGVATGTGKGEVDTLTGNGSGFAVNNDPDTFVLGSKAACFYIGGASNDYASITDFNQTYDKVQLYKGTTATKYIYMDDATGFRSLYLDLGTTGTLDNLDDLIAKIKFGTSSTSTTQSFFSGSTTIPSWVAWA